MNANGYSTQNTLLLETLLSFYKNDNNLDKMLNIINGKSKTSLRIVDWFSTNYAKKYFTVYDLEKNGTLTRFKVYMDYKLKLRAYSKRRFDPFCRWERITVPYKENTCIQTTIGQLNFFKWAIENNVLNYIENNFAHIERDMNERNSTAKRRNPKKDKKNELSTENTSTPIKKISKTRKKREELSISAAKSVKKEDVEIIIKFD